MPFVIMKLFNKISNGKLYKEFPNCTEFVNYFEKLLLELQKRNITLNIIIERGKNENKTETDINKSN